MVNYKKLQRKEDKKNQEIENLKSNIDSLQRQVLILEELKHDIGRLANLVLSASENLNTQISNNARKEDVLDTASTIIHTTSMISPRIIYSDMELSNGQMQNGARFNSGVYKKFDKAKRILRKLANQRSVKVFLHNSSNHTIQALTSFDMVPFIILENAVKYSPMGGEVNIVFDENSSNENNNKLEVLVSSVGPFLTAEELLKITHRGFRSNNAKIKAVSGQGLGLYIADNICRFHGIKLDFDSVYRTDIDDVKYGFFQVRLTFSNNPL
ncbi:ATP-binding protein [Pantoea ananatis]|uniref:ATP-binding protein n=1 Tax=Pantoea ananas TaxID=553 RepID=UPI00301B4275